MIASSRGKLAVVGALALTVIVVLVIRGGRDVLPTSEAAGQARVVAAVTQPSAPAPETPVAPPAPEPGHQASPMAPQVSASWGAAPGELGRELPEDEHANPVGPMSFAPGPDGQLLVLDQVNGRIARFDRDGRYLGALPLSQQRPQDLAVAPDGSILVLDALGDRSVAILDSAGNPKGELALSGPGFKNDETEPELMPEAATGVIVDGDDVYVEQDRGSLVRVGSVDGTADTEQPHVPGRPSRDGLSYVLASVVDPFDGQVLVNSVERTTLERRFTRLLRMGLPVLNVAALDTDGSGVIYLATTLEVPVPQEPTPGAPLVASLRILRLVCLSPRDGSPLGLAELPANEGPEETFRDLQVLPAGGVLYAHRTASGVRYERYDCQ